MRKPGTQPHTSGGNRAGGVQKATIEPAQDTRGHNREHDGPAGERDAHAWSVAGTDASKAAEGPATRTPRVGGKNVQERAIGSAGDADHGDVGIAAEDAAADVDDAHERVTAEGDAVDDVETAEDEPVEAGAAEDGEALPPGSVEIVEDADGATAADAGARPRQASRDRERDRRGESAGERPRPSRDYARDAADVDAGRRNAAPPRH